MKKLFFLIIILISISSLFLYPQQIENFTQLNDIQNEPEIVPGVVVIKLKANVSTNTLSKVSTTFGVSSLDSKLQKYRVLGVTKMFNHKPILENFDFQNISKILKVQIPKDVNPLLVIRDLKSDPNIEYAEPAYKRWLMDLPNDPRFSEQDYLKQIQAPEAWNIQKGDTNVIIAVVDNGIDLEHEDLKKNLWTNKLEANGIEGVDDDNNGFIDDINGWDFGTNTNNPSSPSDNVPFYDHGTVCAGIICAETNNEIGISGISWNCKIMPVKLSVGDTYIISNGYEGIKYAADNGADIISISWGGFGYLRWEQDIINYAKKMGAIVVCAAGNTGSELLGYPASYQNSISVAAVNDNDLKSPYSSFGPSIDIVAPGNNIMSTVPNNQYMKFTGTSMACPIVAGVLGLAKSHFPHMSIDQIIRQVLLSSDNINSINQSFRDQIGHGRINAYQSLTVTELPDPGVRFSIFSYVLDDSTHGNHNNIFEIGETILLNVAIRNYSIGNTNSALFTLSCSDPGIEIIDGNFNNIQFQADTTLFYEFSFMINENLTKQRIELKLNMQTTEGYFREESIYLNVGANPILLIDNDEGYDYWPGTNVESFYQNILEHHQYSFWDCSKYRFPKSELLLNFPIIIIFKEIISDGRFLEGTQNEIRNYLDNGGNLFICGPNIGYQLIEKEPEIYSKEFLNNYLHSEYIENKSSNLDVIGDGIDFNIWQPLFPPFLQSHDVIYPTEGASSLFTYGNGQTAAVKFSEEHKVVYLGFGLESIDSDENTQLGDLSPIRTEVLMRSLNWLNFIEHESLKDTSDIQSSREVKALVRSISPELESMSLFWRLKGEENFNTLPMEITSDTTELILTSFIPGPDLDTTVEYYIQSEFEYYTWTNPIGAPENFYSYKCGNITSVENSESLPTKFSLSQNYPNPFNPNTTIKYSIPSRTVMLNSFQHLKNGEIPKQVRDDNANVSLKVYDILGREVTSLVNQKQKPGNYEVIWEAMNQPSGVYFYKIQAGDYVETKKMILLR